MGSHTGFDLLSDINASGRKITNLGAPVDPADAFRLQDSLITDVTVSNVSSYLISGLNGNVDGAYRFIIEGYEHNAVTGAAYMPLIRPNSDAATANYANIVHWSTASTQGVDPVTTSGIVIGNDGEGTNGFLSEGILRATVWTGKVRMCRAWGNAYTTTNPTMIHCVGIWKNTTDNITSLLFVFPNNFTGRIILFRR